MPENQKTIKNKQINSLFAHFSDEKYKKHAFQAVTQKECLMFR